MNVVAKVVCWKCKTSGGRSFKIDPVTKEKIWTKGETLYRLEPKEKGKHKQFKQVKNIDYGCSKHRFDKPPIGNVSFIPYKSKDQMKYEKEQQEKWLAEEKAKIQKKAKKPIFIDDSNKEI